MDQRIAIRYHLNTLDDTHSAAYIGHRLKMAGQPTSMFTDEAVKLIFDFTRGTPREINNLCDISLLVGYSRRARAIDESIVAEVIKDMVGVT
jgi:general secretion pathway protein A